jgi:RNA polymerase sigma factor for flagellar operon FliA
MAVKKLENEMEYWERYKDEEDMTARDDLIVQYAPLVKHVVGKIAKKMPPNVEFDDLIGYGTLGLIDAIEKYDHTRGIKFKTYAIPRVRGAVLDELRARDWIPRSIRRKARRVQNAISELENRHGRAVSNEEIAEHMGMQKEDLDELLMEISGTSLLSLDEMWDVNVGDDEVSIQDAVEGKAEYQPDNIVDEEELKNLLGDAIKKLPEKERIVITLYYYEDLTLREIGEVLDVTESRVSQIHSKATVSLRSKLSEFEEACTDVL